MTCIHCNGLVEWKGPLASLSHTECLSCGNINCETPEDRAAADCLLCEGFGEIDGDECAQCLGSGLSDTCAS